MTKVNFGFEKVEEGQKQSRVRQVFDSVASRYDIMNDVMSGGLHRLWKNEFVSGIKLQDDCQILDLAGGTGDIALRLVDKARKKNVNVQIIVADINQQMLDEGRNRAYDRGIVSEIDWQMQDAEKLTFPDETFDLVTMAFGIRNVTHIDSALAEIHRVLKPGGKFHCLEFVPEIPIKPLNKIYDFYSFNIIPKLGQAITGDAGSYKYLAESIRLFPKPAEFENMIKQVGFTETFHRLLIPGVCAIHIGIK